MEIRQLVKDWRALESSVLEGRCRFSPKRLTEIEYLGFKRIRNWHFCREFNNDLANDKKIPISLIREAIRTQLFCCEYIGTSVTQAWERGTRSARTKINHVACLRVSFTCFRNFHIEITVLVLVLANSLINPIIYAIRMPKKVYHSYFTGSQTFLVSPRQTCHFETLIERRLMVGKLYIKVFF